VPLNLPLLPVSLLPSCLLVLRVEEVVRPGVVGAHVEPLVKLIATDAINKKNRRLSRVPVFLFA